MTALHSYDPALAGELDDFLEDATAPPGFYRPPYTMTTEPVDVGGLSATLSTTVPAPWRITDDDACDWAMRKVVRATERLDEIRMLAEDRIATIRAWFEQQRKGPESTIDFFSALLKDYALEQRAATKGARKSVSVPSGVVSTSKHAEAVELADADLLLDWLETRAQALIEVWCQIEPKPLISRIRPEVAIKTGSVCARCGLVIVDGPEPDDGRALKAGFEPPPPVLTWRSAFGAACPATNEGVDHRHYPLTDEGELVLRPTPAVEHPLYGWLPVPGLAVKPESVSATVKPAQS